MNRSTDIQAFCHGIFPLMEMFRSRLLHQLVCTFVLASCVSPLDRFAEYSGGQIVISGQVSSLEENNVIYVGRTSDRHRLPEPVEGALVTLYEDGNISFNFSEDPEVRGKYLLPNFQGTPGHTYQIEVALPDGETFSSAPEKMPVLIGNDDVYYSIEKEEFTDEDGIVADRYFIKIYTSHALPSAEEPVFLKWHVEEVYILSPTDFPDPFGNVPPSCYIDQPVDPQRIVLFSTEGIKATSIPDLLVASRQVDATFKERHYFTTFQSSITREAYEYWRKVDILANQTGSIFDGPPARVQGNIASTSNPEEEVHGYFQAVNQKWNRFYVLPSEIPIYLKPHCEYSPQRQYNDYPSECLDCLSVRNSSYNRPPWF